MHLEYSTAHKLPAAACHCVALARVLSHRAELRLPTSPRRGWRVSQCAAEPSNLKPSATSSQQFLELLGRQPLLQWQLILTICPSIQASTLQLRPSLRRMKKMRGSWTSKQRWRSSESRYVFNDPVGILVPFQLDKAHVHVDMTMPISIEVISEEVEDDERITG